MVMVPKTKLQVSADEAASIRAAVRNVEASDTPLGRYELITLKDAPELLTLLQDERVSGDVYTLPRPFSLKSIEDWIEDHEQQKQRGEGFLLYVRGADNEIMSMMDFQIWPEYSACEFGGVIVYKYQSQSYGGKGVKFFTDWTMETLGVRLMVMTASLENIRSQKLLDHLGYTRMGEVESIRPDGSIRRSLYWEY